MVEANNVPEVAVRIPAKLKRYLHWDKNLLKMVVGEGGDYIQDFIRQYSLHNCFTREEVTEPEAEKLAAVSGYDFSGGKMGNKEFVRIQDGRFLCKHDFTFWLYTFGIQKMSKHDKCVCGHSRMSHYHGNHCEKCPQNERGITACSEFRLAAK